MRRTLSFRALLLSFGALLGAGVPVASQLVGAEFQVNQSTEGWQFEPTVAAAADGGFVVVWSGDSLESQRSSVFGRFYDASGTPLTGELRLSGATTNAHTRPVVAVNLDGSFLVAWSGNAPGGLDGALLGRLHAADGEPLGGEFTIASNTIGTIYSPAAGAIGGGDRFVLWGDSGSPGAQVFARRYDASGTPAGSAFQLTAAPGGVHGRPAIASRPHAAIPGEFVVAWHSYSDSQGSYDVFAQRFDADGLPMGEAFQAHEGTLSAQRDPVVAMNGDGAFVVVWSDFAVQSATFDILARGFDAGGVPSGPSFQVSSDQASSSDSPAVAADETGDFVVAWRSRHLEGPEDEILARRVSAQGRTLGSELRINTHTTGNQHSPTIAGDLQGRVIVAWTSEGQDGSVAGVFGQRVEGPLLADGFESADVCVWSASVGGGSCP